MKVALAKEKEKTKELDNNFALFSKRVNDVKLKCGHPRLETFVGKAFQIVKEMLVDLGIPLTGLTERANILSGMGTDSS
ncbi:hypothetical protein RJT34_14342 [Clitoria ternatea]|uniref:Uncharacterized protein n=1 Tax=Clitoria ternatea TaxID=43366 RepID=A0AAN9JSZ5_CLITE